MTGPSSSSNSMTETQVASVRRPNPLIVVMATIIVILLAVIAGLMVSRGGGSASGSAATATSSPTAVGQNASPSPTAAAAQTDPATLELMHTEVHRDPADAQATGQVDAPVVMVLYSDFACPYCTVFAQDVEPGLQDLIDDGTLRIEWRDLAQITPTSPLAAQAGIAAGNQGRFWQFHDAVYAAADPTGHPTYSEESLVALAQQAGVPDLEQFRADMNDAATVQAVSQARDHAYQLGIKGTPFMIVGDAVIAGAQSLEFVRATVLQQAQAAGK